MEASVAGNDGLLEAVAEGEDWEAVLFEGACRAARQEARRLLEAIDRRLAEQRPAGLAVECVKPRTVLTRFGPVTVPRRGYRERASGRLRWLLDEQLGWDKRRAFSQQLQLLVADVAGDVSYRKAVRLVERLVPQGPGRSTAHRLVGQVGVTQQAQEAAQAEGLEQGVPAPPEVTPQPRLFVEADGLSVPLQRAEQRRAEVKAAVVYRGTCKLGVDRHGRVRRQTLGAVCFADLETSEAFWERFWGQVAQRYDLEALRELVVGGDGARWIRDALEAVGPQQQGVFQLDRFHLLRALRRALGPETGPAVQAVAQEELAGLRRHLEQALAESRPGPRRQALQACLGYLVANADGLLRWTTQLGVAPDDQPPLGSMETRIDKLLAERVKKHGMSWSPHGLRAMCKVRQLKANRQLRTTCLRHSPSPPPRRNGRQYPRRVVPSQARTQQPPFQARLAPRYGPHASRPWVQALVRLSREPSIR